MSIIVKICGLSTAESVDTALTAGADMIGFVFFPPSPRAVLPAPAAALAEPARGRAEVVALTVDMDDAGLDEVVERFRPDWLQLHGSETPDRLADLKARYGLKLMKAIGVSTASDLDAVDRYRDVADRILFDAKPPKDADRPGGLGKSFDWTLIAGRGRDLSFMLSGGIDAGNVATALAVTAAPGVDVSSGVESAPGVKDVGRIRDFIAAVRAFEAAAPQQLALGGAR